jgi:hypothetical protein
VFQWDSQVDRCEFVGLFFSFAPACCNFLLSTLKKIIGQKAILLLRTIEKEKKYSIFLYFIEVKVYMSTLKKAKIPYLGHRSACLDGCRTWGAYVAI